MQPSQSAEQDLDRRDAPRSDLPGHYSMTLDPGDGRAPIACDLLDFSITGARLRLPADLTLPDNVQILIGGLSHNARVVWRDGRAIGVDFIDEHHDIY